MVQPVEGTPPARLGDFGFDRVYVGREACKWLYVMKGRLQMEEGAICRLAICLSLGARYPPDLSLIDQEGGKTFPVAHLSRSVCARVKRQVMVPLRAVRRRPRAVRCRKVHVRRWTCRTRLAWIGHHSGARFSRRRSWPCLDGAPTARSEALACAAKVARPARDDVGVRQERNWRMELKQRKEGEKKCQ